MKTFIGLAVLGLLWMAQPVKACNPALASMLLSGGGCSSGVQTFAAPPVFAGGGCTGSTFGFGSAGLGYGSGVGLGSFGAGFGGATYGGGFVNPFALGRGFGFNRFGVGFVRGVNPFGVGVVRQRLFVGNRVGVQVGVRRPALARARVGVVRRGGAAVRARGVIRARGRR